MIKNRRIKYERLATASSCCGFTGEVVLTDSAVIILYAGMLGAGDQLSLLVTSILPLVNGLLIVPAACIAARFGFKKVIMTACGIAFCAYLTAASAAWFGTASVMILIGMILLFSVSLSGFVAGWFPMLATFLEPESRADFLGRMRFCHQLTATFFLGLSSLLVGKAPSAQRLQLILFGAVLIFSGRAIFISRIPALSQNGNTLNLSWYKGLVKAIKDPLLTFFSVYQFPVNIASYALTPLTIIYLKNELHIPANQLVLLSALTLIGMLSGYLFSGKFLTHFGHFRCFQILHILFIASGLLLFLPFISGCFAAVAAVLMINTFGIAFFSILASDLMMRLAQPENRTMAMAWCGAFFYGGAGGSRVITSILLGLIPAMFGISAPRWIFLLCSLLLIATLSMLPGIKKITRK